MRYISTRGKAPPLNFEDVVLAGLANDGGLYLPETMPKFEAPELEALAPLNYTTLAYEIISRFTGDSLAEEELRSLIADSYSGFRHSAVAPIKQLDNQLFLLELFHGPTLAFKDFALQFLGRLLNYFLKKRGARALVLGATSGDTGSAAIAGCAGFESMDVVILHPHERVSSIQRRQMTTIEHPNVHNLAIEGSFDDCQAMVKALFSDEAFRSSHHLTAVNSINWARILAQVVYYFYAALSLGAPARKISFSVPTGNFGDIYAGYVAKKMGLPIDLLVIATNRNDILARTLATGRYAPEETIPSLSPSMDIQVSSNFERLLFDIYGRDAAAIHTLMTELKAEKRFELSDEAYSALRREFAAASVTDEETKLAITRMHALTGELLDPHTAVGLVAGQRVWQQDKTAPLVVLATAHPAKFPEAIIAAGLKESVLPAHMADIMEKEERMHILPNDVQAVKRYIDTNL